MTAFVEAIYVAPARRVALASVHQAVAVAGRGLEGDRYHAGVGSFSRWPDPGRAVSLIAAEAIEAVLRETGIDLGEGRSRRNLVTRGADLGALVGRTFRVGGVVLRGNRPCQPCAYLERLVGPGTFAALKGRGGLRADVVEGGVIQVGDALVVM